MGGSLGICVILTILLQLDTNSSINALMNSFSNTVIFLDFMPANYKYKTKI